MDTRYATFDPNVKPILGELASTIKPEVLAWLWPDYIPQGLLTLVAGDPGSGKSTIIADLVGRYTSGRPFPDGAAGTSGNVVMLNAEDPRTSVMLPRLMLAEANLDRVRLVGATTKDDDNTDRLIALPDDLEIFERTITRSEARLAIVDPLNSYVTGRVNSFKDAEVRRMLAALSGVAERTGAAIIVVMHLNKGESENAMYRVGGSIAYVGSARAAFLVAPDPEDETGGRRVFQGVKNNYTPNMPGLGFRLVGDGAYNMARVDWTGAVAGSTIRLLQRPRPQSEIDKACATLHGLLKGGERLADDVEKEMEAAGISGPTYRRARLKLGVRRKQRDRRWWIGLADSGDQPSPYYPLDHMERADHLNGASPDPDDRGDQNSKGDQGDHLNGSRSAALPAAGSERKE